MPLIKPSSPPLRVQAVVTTTVLAGDPTATGRNDSGHTSSVPVGAIVGGIVAGAVLAILVTVGWIWWGKAIKKNKRKQQQEMDKHRTTRQNTLQNARISEPKNHSYRPLLRRGQDDKRVKFAGDEKPAATLPPSEHIDLEKAKHMLFDNPNTPPPRPLWTLSLNPLKKLSQNSIRSTTNHASPEPSSSQTGSTNSAPTSSRDAERPPPLPHKPSNVSTHSTASAQQGRVPASLLAALGNMSNRNSLHAGDRQSTSSLWSHLFRAMPGARSSQHSGGENAYHPSEREDAFPVGTAM